MAEEKKLERDRRITVIIQAHMSSTRLPGKIMLDFCGQPALYRMIERVRKSRLIDDIVIATSTLDCDDIIVEKCAEWGVHTFRGSDSDVLSRYWGASQEYPSEVYVRMTSDCPCIDASWADKTIQYFLDHDFRYVSNAVGDMPPTVPMGIGLEVFEASLLEEAYRNSTEHYEHEHVTPYMYWKQPSMGALAFPVDAHDVRITLDTPEDYRVLSAIYEALYRPGNDFTVFDILDFLEAHPEIAEINKDIYQKKATD